MTYSKDNLRQTFQHPFNHQEWQQMLRHYFQATELRAEPERIDGTTDDEQGYYLGAIDTNDSYRIGLFYYQIQHGNVARKRVGLRNLVKSFVNPNWGEFDAALVVFDSGKLWRLSFVSDIKGESTAPKRYTYVFGEGDSFYNTPVGRFDALQRKGISFENIKDAFSVEALSKEFFDEYREHYADIVEYITGKRYVKEKGKWVEKTIHEPCHEIFDQFAAVYKDPEKTVRDYIKKLMGRLVFLQFLQKKGWMGVPANRRDWTGGDARFLQNKFNELADKDNFIDGFLEPLFNDLNTNRQNRGDLASSKVGKDIKIPFLNGGLFQLDEEDCSQIRLPQHLLGDVLDFFERYNFTIDENDPNDAQIGVDPEMLGRVFENLLEDNKDKGAFYTPKEIVQYMCQESLIAYLQTGIEDETDKESIRQFVLTHEAEHLGSMAEDISIKLLNVKICDPAIGSGAFPMGLLRQLYLCQCAIHPELEEKNAADIKRHIIQNNIYGVDIEKGAVDIARLRFWLSLIVDEETPRFLPNLDFKIMQGNSLLEQYKGVDLSKMTTLSTEQGEGTQLTWFDKELDILRFDLREKLNEYYNCSDHQRKEQLKQKIIDNVKQQLCEQSINVDFGDLDLSANDQFTLWHTWFYDVFSQGGFDIVIGNPPYVNVQLMTTEEKDLYRKTYESFFKRCDMFCLFLELGLLKLSAKRGIVTLIIPSVVHSNMSYQKIRDLILNQQWLQEVHYTGGDVFNAPTVDTTILVCNKNGNDHITLTDAVDFLHPKSHQVDADYFGRYNNVISIGDELGSGVFDKLFNPKFDVVDLHYNVFQGIVTGNNPAFIFETEQEAEDKGVDATLLHPLCHGRDLEKYKVRSRDRRILYIDNNVNIEDYPQTRNWLLNYKDALDTRREVKRGVINWCGLQWPRVKTELDLKEKILVQNTRNEALKTRIVATLDDCSVYGTQGINFIIPKDSEDSLRYLLGILNSKLINYLFATKFLNLAIKAEYVKQVRIPYSDRQQIQKIEILVDTILQNKQSNVDTAIEETAIDLLVYHLYGLTYDEILIVDPETPITREEYEK